MKLNTLRLIPRRLEMTTLTVIATLAGASFCTPAWSLDLSQAYRAALE